MNLSNQSPAAPDLRYTGITIPGITVCETARGDRNVIANAIATQAIIDRTEKQADTPMWFYLTAGVLVLGAFLSGKRGKR